MTQQIPPRQVSTPPPEAPPDPDGTTPVDETAVPRRAEGVSLLGEYEGGGYSEPRYLVSRGDDQMVMVTPMLYAVLGAVTGDRTLAEVAEHAGETHGAELTSEAVQYLIERKLQPLGLVTLGEQVKSPPRANPLLALHLHRQLIPAKVVRRLAAFFAPMFVPPIVASVALALLILDVWLVANGHAGASISLSVGSPFLTLSVIGVTLVNTLFHECGHAAGCHYGGGKPGGIGVGILVYVPAFYTNVNDAYRLDRRGRLRTDLGGIYFNAVFIVFLGAIYLLTHFAAIPAMIAVIHLQMLQQLLPLVRLDGYYILGDIVGVPNLFEQIPRVVRQVILRRGPDPAIANLRRRVRVAITVWVCLVVPILIAALVRLVVVLPGYLATATRNMVGYWHVCTQAFGHGNVPVMLVALIAIVILMVPWVGATSLLIRTGVKIGRMVRKLRRRIAMRRAAPKPPELAGSAATGAK
ncbi:MAG TPA: hypothetical protein VJT49_05125 [Amycolatopsis sp.]|uniref:hypothetical protein n=1 Tax=Amycolatopsis sp. TaxID=37632 RepID=UPI002B49D12F|nr:hypothetical protein [Amycolatopsis sp.]HKS44489.1 hypothetical protein [Amycolatopsis sp.]